jgi:hypothetical protein
MFFSIPLCGAGSRLKVRKPLKTEAFRGSLKSGPETSPGIKFNPSIYPENDQIQDKHYYFEV